MKFIARITLVAIVALSLAGASHAGTASTPTAKNCFFVRNNLPCPCPRGQQARTVAHAVGLAIGKTAVAFARADHKQGTPADSRHASQHTQPAKR